MTEAEWRISDDPRFMLQQASASDRQLRLFACAYARTGSWLVELSAWRYQTLSTRVRARNSRPTEEQALQALLAIRRIGARGLTPVTFRGQPPMADRGEEVVALAEAFAEGTVTAREFAAQADLLEEQVYEDDSMAAYAGPSAFLAGEQSRLLRAVLAPTGRQAAEMAISSVTHYFVGLADSGPLRGYGRILREELRLQTNLLQASLLREIIDPFHPVGIDPVWRLLNEGIVLRLAEAIYEERDWERMPILGDALEEAGCADHAILDHCRLAGEHVRGCRVLDAILGRS